MTTGEITAKLQRAADRIIAYGDGTARYIPGARTWALYEFDREKDALTVGDAIAQFKEERIWAEIDPGGKLTVKQNWSEPFSNQTVTIEAGPSDETRSARQRITAHLDGRRPHPEVEWTLDFGPWVTGRMNGEVFLRAGVPRSPAPHVIIMPDGSTAKTFTEAERLLTNRFFPGYAPISLEFPKTKSGR